MQDFCRMSDTSERRSGVNNASKFSIIRLRNDLHNQRSWRCGRKRLHADCKPNDLQISAYWSGCRPTF